MVSRDRLALTVDDLEKCTPDVARHLVQLLANPTAAIIEAGWANLPSPWETDMEVESAMRQMLTRVIVTALNEISADQTEI